MSARDGEGAERRPFDTPVAAVEADINEGYVAYLAEIVEGLWPGETLATAISFAEYRRDYWREALPDLMSGTS